MLTLLSGVGFFIMPISFEIIDSEGVIYIESNTESFSPFNLSIDTFWSWVRTHELHGFCSDYFDATQPDCHGQDAGYFTKEQYFDLHYELIKKDLIDYLVVKRILKSTI